MFDKKKNDVLSLFGNIRCHIADLFKTFCTASADMNV